MKVLIVSNNVLSTVNNNGKTLFSFFEHLARKDLGQLYFSNEKPEIGSVYGYFNVNDNDVLNSIVGLDRKAGRVVSLSSDGVGSEALGGGRNGKNLLREFESVRLGREIAWAASSLDEVALEQWIMSFKPDMVFFCAGDSGFAYRIYDKVCSLLPEAKKCLYITDDYILPRPTLSISWWVRRQIILNCLKRSLSKSDVFVTISDKMRRKYKELLGRDSIVAFNMPKDLRIEGFEKSARDDLVMTYAGGLHYNRWKTLRLLGDEIDEFNKINNRAVSLKIYSHQALSKKIKNSLAFPACSTFYGAVDEAGVRYVLNDADILVHVESFSKKNVYSTRLSLSTKIAEYLTVGKRIIAIGPSELASMEFISKAACCVNSVKDLKGTLGSFLNSDIDGYVLDESVKNELKSKEMDFRREVLAEIM